MESLISIQHELKAPKSQFNSFGKYKYRNTEDILEALKPLLVKYKCTLFISDEIIQISDRIYVKATCHFSDGKKDIKVSAMARESENKKGMDDSQITGTASSYSRKYALNGLFLIDDTKDADFNNNSKDYSAPKPKPKPKPTFTPESNIWDKMVDKFIATNPQPTIKQIREKGYISQEHYDILKEQAVERAFRETQK